MTHVPELLRINQMNWGNNNIDCLPQQPTLPDGIVPTVLPEVPVLVPQGSEVILRCTVEGSYKYPFKKVRIYNCNLEEARGKSELE